MGKRVPVRTKAKLRDAANEHMTMLEKSPERVMSFFQMINAQFLTFASSLPYRKKAAVRKHSSPLIRYGLN